MFLSVNITLTSRLPIIIKMEEEMQFQKLYFVNREGHRLAARLDLPLGEKPAAYAIFAHCFTCTKNLNAVVNINRSLARNGIAVLRFDFTGLGDSEGDFAETNFSSNVADLVAAADFLRENFVAPKLLVGHSLGGAAVLQAASQIESCVGVATIGAPANPTDVTRHLVDSLADIFSKGAAEIALAGRKFKLKKQFLDDLEQVHMQKTIEQLGKPLVVFHSPKDEIVGIENAKKIFEAAKHPKSFISLDTADHLLSARNDSIYVGSMLAAWAGKYLDQSKQERPVRDLSDNRIVARVGRKGYQTEIQVNEHSLIADEPIAVGGANTGPTPYGLLVAALGACTAMTLRMYADRKNWPLEAATVRLKHRKIHAADCAGCTEKQGSKIDHIDRELELTGSLDAEQRQRLLEIADKCPVHRTLESGTVIATRLHE